LGFAKVNLKKTGLQCVAPPEGEFFKQGILNIYVNRVVLQQAGLQNKITGDWGWGGAYVIFDFFPPIQC